MKFLLLLPLLTFCGKEVKNEMKTQPAPTKTEAPTKVIEVTIFVPSPNETNTVTHSCQTPAPTPIPTYIPTPVNTPKPQPTVTPTNTPKPQPTYKPTPKPTPSPVPTYKPPPASCSAGCHEPRTKK
jgi:outer membrane biosynthesis protein TonB